MAHNRGNQRRGVTRRGITLTQREIDVLRRAALGQGTLCIAERLGIGRDRVRAIKRSVKLHIGLDKGADTQQMVVQARSIGFIG